MPRKCQPIADVREQTFLNKTSQNIEMQKNNTNQQVDKAMIAEMKEFEGEHKFVMHFYGISAHERIGYFLQLYMY